MVATHAVKVADQVWIAMALLHQEYPDRESFSASEIAERVRAEFGQVRAGIYTHIYLHCVAAKGPRPGRYRILHRTEDGQYRLFRPGDPYHPDREGSKVHPRPEDLPTQYQHLLRWYDQDYTQQLEWTPLTLDHPLWKLVGIGASGKSDIAERHDWYIAEAKLRKMHGESSKPQ